MNVQASVQMIAGQELMNVQPLRVWMVVWTIDLSDWMSVHHDLTNDEKATSRARLHLVRRRHDFQIQKQMDFLLDPESEAKSD